MKDSLLQSLERLRTEFSAQLAQASDEAKLLEVKTEYLGKKGRLTEVVANDPWARLERGERVQKVFPRNNVAKAWKQSHNTVYVIHPESLTDQFLILSKPCLE